VVWDRNGITRTDWDSLGNYTRQDGTGWDGTLGQRRGDLAR
jgi:hypothetical protein